MRTRLLLLLTIFTLVLSKGFSQTPAWAISGPFTSIAADNNGNLLTVDNNTLTRYDTSGQVLGRKIYGAAIDNLAPAAEGSLYITGRFKETLKLGSSTLNPNGDGNIYVARLDNNGEVQWAKQIDRPTGPINLQLATDSRSSVYVKWIEGHYLNVTKFSQDGTFQFSKLLVLGDNPYGDPVNTISIDQQDNLHVFYSSPFVPNPADPLNTINAQSRIWYNSAGVLLGSNRNVKQATREIFRGYKAGAHADDYVTTKTYRTITGAGSTWLGDCTSPQVPCYEAPPVNPDRDRFGNAYYAGYFYERSGGIDCSSPPLSLKFTCSNSITQKDAVYFEKDIYLLIKDSLISTRENGVTDEYPIWLSADPGGNSLYLLASWAPREGGDRKFHFGTSELTLPGRMVLRYRINKPLLNVNAGADKVICFGGSAVIGSANMVGSGSAPFTYSWKPVYGLHNAQTPTPTAQPLSTTDYVVTVTDAAGAIGWDTVRVVVDSNQYKPTITLVSGTNPFCEGDTIVVKASDAVSYLWSNEATTQAIRLTASDSIVVAAVNEAGCVGVSAPFLAVMNNRPPVPELKQSGNTLTIQPTSASCQWYFNGLSIPEASGQKLSIEQGGTYKVIVTDKNGCHNEAALLAVLRVISSRIDHQVFPNPVRGDLNIAYTLKQPAAVGITLKDVLGHNVVTILERQQQPPGDYLYRIDKAAARLQEGYYFVEFWVDKERIVQKVLVL